jgi:hypothetical protein
LYRIIVGEPKRSKKPPTQQAWVKNIQEGGGVSIPCQWILECPSCYVAEVERRLNGTFEEIQGGESLSIKVINILY